MSYIDEIFQRERKPFKISFGYGGIYEEEQSDGTYKHINKPALQFETGRFAPVVVRDEQTKQLFMDYFKTALMEMINNYTLISTKHKLVCIHSFMFKVFRLAPIGARLPGLDEFIKSKMIRCPTEDDNLCFDYVATMFKHPQLKTKDMYRRGRCYAYERVFGQKPNVNSQQYRQWIREYPGFDFTNDITHYCHFYQVNVDVYEKHHNSYTLTHQHIVHDDYAKLSMLLVSFNKIIHAMLILPHKVDRLTGFIFCDKCQQIIARGDDHSSRALKRHRKHCTGKVSTQKRCMLDTTPQPYIPHIMKNRVYAYCLAHNINYQPIRYYITFDFETVEHRVESRISDKTVINSHLRPLSVASCVKAKDGINRIYYDLRNGSNFIHQWLDDVFFEANRMRNDNIIDGVPLDIQLKQSNHDIPNYIIPVIGFNSARFDMNILFNELYSKSEDDTTTERDDTWRVRSFLGSSTSFKQVLISKTYREHKHKYDVTLKFIDAKALSGPGTLRDFIKSFGSEGCTDKGVFPYEAFDDTNYNEVLSKSEPFTQSDFRSYLNQSTISDSDYAAYLEDARRFKTRWDYLRHYNMLDVESMISPLDNIIKFTWERNVDALRNLSLSANASAIKYAMCYTTYIMAKSGYIPVPIFSHYPKPPTSRHTTRNITRNVKNE